jgi:hypothetical protein
VLSRKAEVVKPYTEFDINSISVAIRANPKLLKPFTHDHIVRGMPGIHLEFGCYMLFEGTPPRNIFSAVIYGPNHEPLAITDTNNDIRLLGAAVDQVRYVNYYCSPYFLDDVNGIWHITNKVTGKTKLYIPNVPFSALTVVDASLREVIDRYDTVLRGFAFTIDPDTMPTLGLCGKCGKSQTAHLMEHISRNEMDRQLMRSLFLYNGGEWTEENKLAAWQCLRKLILEPRLGGQVYFVDNLLSQRILGRASWKPAAPAVMFTSPPSNQE